MERDLSISEIFQVLNKHRTAIFFFFAFFSAFSILYTFLKERTYTFSTALEIGSFPIETENGKDRRLIEPSVDVERKLRLAYIPLARNRLGLEFDGIVPNVQVSNDGTGGRLFILSSLGPFDSEQKVADIHRLVLKLLVDDNNATLQQLVAQQESKINIKQAELDYWKDASVRQASLKLLDEKYQSAKQKLSILDQEFTVKVANIDAKIRGVEADLSDIKATKAALQTSIQRLDEKEKLLKEQIDVSFDRLEQLQGERDKAVSEAAKNANAVAVLMLGSEVANLESRLWDLRNSLNVELARERTELEQRLVANNGNETKALARLAELQEERLATINQLPGERTLLQTELDRLRGEIQKGEKENELTVKKLEETVESLKSELADMVPTRALYLGVRDIEPIGPSNTSIVILGVISGLFVGVLWVIMYEAIIHPGRSK